MSVIVAARLGGKRKSDIDAAGRNRYIDIDSQDEATRVAVRSGRLEHEYLAGESEVWLLEEWETTEAFETFFDRTPSFRQAIDQAGFKGCPDDIVLWELLSSEDWLSASWSQLTWAE